MTKFSFVVNNTYLGPEAYQGHPFPTPNAAYDPGVGTQSWLATLELADLAEEVGLDWVTVTEHHYAPFVGTPSPTMMAAVLTQRLKRVEICVFGPLVPLGSPVRVAEEIAQLDVMAPGRIRFMPLRGTPNEFRSVNLDAATSRAMTQEGTELIMKTLAEREPFQWSGQHYQFSDVSIWPPLTSRPYPPMYYSGNSEESVLFAAKHRMGIGFSFYPSAIVADLVKLYYSAAADAGWEPEPDQIVYRTVCAIADTESEADEIRGRFFGPQARQPELPTTVGTDADGKQHGGADSGGAGFGFGELRFCGTSDAVAEDMWSFQQETGVGVFDMGMTMGHVTFAEMRRSLELYGREVIPRFRQIESAAAEDAAVAT